MTMRLLASACLTLFLLAPAQAEDPLVHEAIIEAPVQAVWDAFTTNKGMESWNVAHAEIDLRVGGLMRTHYDKNGKIGDPNTIENTILAYDPRRMLAIKATKPPANFPFKKAMERVWSVIYFEAAAPGKTRVTIHGLGYGTDDEAQKMRGFFQQGNVYVLGKLQQLYAPKK
jgi:uncharacterized protein YndB with AHSA1/START domain